MKDKKCYGSCASRGSHFSGNEGSKKAKDVRDDEARALSFLVALDLRSAKLEENFFIVCLDVDMVCCKEVYWRGCRPYVGFVPRGYMLLNQFFSTAITHYAARSARFPANCTTGNYYNNITTHNYYNTLSQLLSQLLSKLFMVLQLYYNGTNLLITYS